ncbi:hypothetical protein BKA63DRAFT_604770 [Paraphoma chrysanthemicola]|nr:hypothetical protein BKA63DRAFT_604770 [Paraphoma chrysanthemicola]
MAQYGGANNFGRVHPVVTDWEKWKRERMTTHRNAVTYLKETYFKLWADYIIPYCPDLPHNTTGITDMAYVLKRMHMKDLVPVLNTIVMNRITAKSSQRPKKCYLIGVDWTDCKEFLRCLTYWVHDKVSSDPDSETSRKIKGVLADQGQKDDFINLTSQGKEYGLVHKMDFTNRELNGMWQYLLTQYLATNPTTKHKGLPAENWKITLPNAETMKEKYQLALCQGLNLPIPAQYMTLGAVGRHGGVITGGPLAPPEAMVQEQARALQELRSVGRDMEPNPEGKTDKQLEARGHEYATKADQLIEQLVQEENMDVAPAMEGPLPTRQLRSAARKALVANNPEALDEIDLDVVEEEPQILGDDDDGGLTNMDLQQIRDNVKCRCSDQNSKLVQLIQQMAAGKSKKPLKGAAISRLLSFWWQEIVDRSKRVNSNKEKLKDISRVCFHHLRFIAAKVGLQHRALNQENMSNVLEVLKTHPNKWVEYQNDPQYRVLFRAGFRAEYENQDMLSYRFRPAMLEAPDLDYDSIIKEMGWTGIVKEFRRTGTLITDCFSWMFKDPDLVKIIDGSFDAFRWHQRRIGGKENLGWNRAMFHSIPQQLVRGDIEYWLLYACLRREYWLISYPYYTKQSSMAMGWI